MGVSISKTLQQAGGNFARPTKFNILLNPPPSLIQEYGSAIDILCKNVTIPTISMSPIEINIKGHKVKYPSRVQQEQTFSVTFYMDEHYKIRQLFTDWISATDNRFYAPRSDATAAALKSKEKYGNMIIQARNFEETPNVKPMAFLFEGVFPISVGDVAYSTSDKDSILSQEVTFAYYRYYHKSYAQEHIEELDAWLDQFGKSPIGRTKIGNSFSSVISSGSNILGGARSIVNSIGSLGGLF
jgi:hypothetical protein